ncbi:unnamed protein product [Rotaria sordida]|uniref:RING-type domain-containing protein n=1 Tax=Rotaria sordida TaxID=392033 RepID=A0A814Q6M5_9BILA|nr:unnamed protein product [Rotaria sordida]
MHSNVELLPICLPSGAMDCAKVMSTKEDINSHYYQSNSTSSDQESNLDDYVIVSSSASIISSENNSSEENLLEQEDDSDYFAQFSCPNDDSDDDLEYFYNNNNNDDIFINNHLNRKQLYLAEQFEEKNYQRSKRSNKKINAHCQIKTKHAKNIKIKSHNKQLYMHHRLVKRVVLDEPSRNYLPSNPSTPLYSFEALRSLVYEHRHLGIGSNRQSQVQQQTIRNNNNNNNTSNVTNQLREYTINENNILNDPCFDDAMINFLLDMQNRDLSPNDYEMLLRLDERVQRKTVDVNILDKFPTLNVSETHLNDQCTICMEAYTLGQTIKSLPCTHIFHVHCIEIYLKEFSIQCPLDNLPLI